MNKRSPDASQLLRVVFFSVCAFFIFGAWGVIANLQHGLDKRLLAGLTQGLLSFVSTAILTTAMETVFRRMPPGAGRFMASGLGPITATLLIMAAAHSVTRTPEIVDTMLPSVVVGYAYSLIYASGLTRRYRQLAGTETAE